MAGLIIASIALNAFTYWLGWRHGKQSLIRKLRGK